MPRLVWLGDADPEAQIITQYGHTFVKGEAVSVPSDDPFLAKLQANPLFAAEKDAEPDDTPPANDERAALKAELRSRGVEVRGNPSLDTLRDRLAAAVK